MKKQLNVTINGKQYLISYSREGSKFKIECENQEIKSNIPGSFSIKNGRAEYLVISDRTHDIFRQIIQQIDQNESKS